LWIILLLISACGRLPAEFGSSANQVVMPRPEIVKPLADIRGSIEGVTTLKLGVENTSQRQIAEAEEFTGRWQILNAGGEVRAEGRMYHLGPLKPEENRYPMAWEATLTTGSYTLLWGAPEIGSLVVDFSVQVSGDAVNIQQVRQRASEIFPPPYVEKLPRSSLGTIFGHFVMQEDCRTGPCPGGRFLERPTHLARGNFPLLSSPQSHQLPDAPNRA
jgi:hypothetical protein